MGYRVSIVPGEASKEVSAMFQTVHSVVLDNTTKTNVAWDMKKVQENWERMFRVKIILDDNSDCWRGLEFDNEAAYMLFKLEWG